MAVRSAVERFSFWFEEADATRPDVFGGKGAGLARMTAAGLPVPPGFIITTDACRAYLHDARPPSGLLDGVRAAVSELERRTGRTFGGGPTPLLLSVRSGAPLSMPGMMDTILNLGLNLEASVALARQTGSLAFVADTYLRFCRMYGSLVLGADGDAILEVGQPICSSLEEADPERTLGELGAAVREALLEEVGDEIPDDPYQQLEKAVEAVFKSWNSRRAITYRKVQKISHDLGTAVVVQAMVFGNLGSPSGTGVAFTRNPITGDQRLYGEFLEGVQGEDVVSGTATPEPLDVAAQRLPVIFAELERVAHLLEELYGDALDIEFTVEQGTLYLLQVRVAKRTPVAAIRIAGDLLREQRLSPGAALAKVSAAQVRETGRPGFEEKALAAARAGGAVLGAGIGASPGQASGVAVLDPNRAADLAGQGEAVILVRPTTSPLDLHGMIAAAGILTALGGATSHAAVVARALNKPCIVGCGALQVDLECRRFSVGDRWLEEGASLSIDGTAGVVFGARIPMTRVETSGSELRELLTLADTAARCQIYGRATTEDQVRAVLESGAQGVATRLGDILATTGGFEDLLRLLVAQRDADDVDMQGFEEVFAEALTPLLKATDTARFTVRAIDFIADDVMESMDGARLIGQNPRLAVPLGIPQLIAAEVAGLALAAARSGYPGVPQLTVRHVTDPNEVGELKRVAAAELDREGRRKILIGATLTSPRGVHLAAEIGRVSEFIWVEVRGIQAALFGYPLSLFLTGEPLDQYVRRRLITVDPRTSLDESMRSMIASLGGASTENPTCTVGLRVAGPVSEEIAKVLFDAGFRTFAVDTHEVPAARLAFGKAALGS